MSENNANSPTVWDDDDLPEWSDEQFDQAQFSVAGKVVRPARSTWTHSGRPRSENPKQQVTLRLDPEVLEKFRATGKGWQSRINAELRKVLGI
jgi:uncharacterized protein (DUF4415 family)